MTGKGGSSSKSTTETKLPPSVSQAQEGQVGATLPILQAFAKQMMEALNTGGVNAQIPMVQRAVEAGKSQASQVNARTDEALARSGVTGPYSRAVSEGVNQQGAFGVSQIAPGYMQQFLQMIPDLALMRGSPVFGGGSSTSTTTSKGTGSGGSFGDTMGGLADLFKIGASIYSMCYVALELYGVGDELMYARWWIGYAWKGRTANVVRRVYGQYGMYFAAVVRRYSFVRALIKPLFDVAVRRGKEAWDA